MFQLVDRMAHSSQRPMNVILDLTTVTTGMPIALIRALVDILVSVKTAIEMILRSLFQEERAQKVSLIDVTKIFRGINKFRKILTTKVKSGFEASILPK